MHKTYEELCALAATGQINGDAMKVLDQHMKECSSCRAYVQDLIPLKAQVTPVVAGSRTQAHTPPEGIRERFLRRAVVAGLRMAPGPPIETPASDTISSQQMRRYLCRKPPSHRARFGYWLAAAQPFAVPALAGVLCGVLGFVIALHILQSKESQMVIVAPSRASTTESDLSAAQIATLRRQNDDANSRAVILSSELAFAQAEKRRLQQELTRLSGRAAAGEQFEQRFKDISAKLEDAESRANRTEADLEAERGRATTAEAVAIAQQRATEEADSKVTTLQNQLDRFREFNSSKSFAGDLISARNLHIVDVYDTEANGDRKRAFGRVFFVEGKSLVFYAYDLPSSHRGKVEFQVWGEQAGLNSISINLGAMHSDDSSQGRWVLTCDDPKVLRRINAVYLTADSKPRSDSPGRGAKLMYAFLGSPNHP